MNYYKQVTEMLGVEPGEEFKVKWESGINFTNSKYCFTKDGLNEVGTTWFAHGIFADILSGKAEIIKLPWKPIEGEEYWYYSEAWKQGISTEWQSGIQDFTFWKVGNCFQTKEEAEFKGKAVMEQIQKEYDKS